MEYLSCNQNTQPFEKRLHFFRLSTLNMTQSSSNEKENFTYDKHPCKSLKRHAKIIGRPMKGDEMPLWPLECQIKRVSFNRKTRFRRIIKGASNVTFPVENECFFFSFVFVLFMFKYGQVFVYGCVNNMVHIFDALINLSNILMDSLRKYKRPKAYTIFCVLLK